ncbi:hypothetical protein ACEUZ9_000851 [Paracoccus litorisediminis]|uniref:hypothetical protein n=1 Tax=Paracoccus litorisediminis TaxID=2006130 RepID=UPI0037348735
MLKTLVPGVIAGATLTGMIMAAYGASWVAILMGYIGGGVIGTFAAAFFIFTRSERDDRENRKLHGLKQPG